MLPTPQFANHTPTSQVGRLGTVASVRVFLSRLCRPPGGMSTFPRGACTEWNTSHMRRAAHQASLPASRVRSAAKALFAIRMS